MVGVAKQRAGIPSDQTASQATAAARTLHPLTMVLSTELAENEAVTIIAIAMAEHRGRWLPIL